MQCQFTFKHLEPLESITQYAESRVEKLEKFNLHKEMTIHFIFSVQKEAQTAEIIVDAGKNHFAAVASDPTLYAAIDSVIDKMETQLKKHKEKVQHHHNFSASNEGYLRQELAAQAEDLRQSSPQALQMKGNKK